MKQAWGQTRPDPNLGSDLKTEPSATRLSCFPGAPWPPKGCSFLPLGLHGGQANPPPLQPPDGGH